MQSPQYSEEVPTMFYIKPQLTPETSLVKGGLDHD